MSASDVRIGPLLLPSDPSPNPRRNDEPSSRILLADDNTDMREYVQRLLREQYEWIGADGESALKSARERRPDLILSDVMMPQMDGFELLRTVRSDKELEGVPVILLSARAGEESRIEGLHAGADDYLVKPFSARELLARVGAHLAWRACAGKLRNGSVNCGRKRNWSATGSAICSCSPSRNWNACRPRTSLDIRQFRVSTSNRTRAGRGFPRKDHC